MRIYCWSYCFSFKGFMRWQTESWKIWSTSFPLFPPRSLLLILRLIKPALWVSSTHMICSCPQSLIAGSEPSLFSSRTLALCCDSPDFVFRSFYETHAPGLQQAVLQSGLQTLQVPAALLPQSLRQAYWWAGGTSCAGCRWLRYGPHQRWGYCRRQNRQRGDGHPTSCVRASVSDTPLEYLSFHHCLLLLLEIF